MSKSKNVDYQRSIQSKSVTPIPIYASGNSLCSTNERLTSNEIDQYFRIVPIVRSSSISDEIEHLENTKEQTTVQYLRPASFEHQQEQFKKYQKNRIEMNPHATFYEKKQLFPVDQKSYAIDYQQKFDQEFLQHWNKGIQGDFDSETTTTSRSNIEDKVKLNSNRSDSINNFKSEHLSDVERGTDFDEQTSESEKEEIRKLFGISRALERFNDYQELKQSINPEEDLPIFFQKDRILSMIEQNSILIIQGTTGSGKSTQIPQYIMDDHVQRSKPVNIVVTQPRRIAARALCQYVSNQRNWSVGQTVGYQTSLNKQRSELTRILYCTTGCLLQKLILSKTLQDYTHIILDEVHERDQAMDFLLILIRALWVRNSSNVKIILMSATIEIDKLRNYFRQVRDGQILPAGQYFIGEQLFDVQDLYFEHILNYGLLPDLKLNEPRLSREAIDLAVKLIHSFDDEDSMSGWDHTKNLPIKRSTVLVFLPGLLEIQTFHQSLRYPKYKFDSNQSQLENDEDQCQLMNYQVIPLHADLSIDDQMNIFTPTKNTFRKIILATNIAESSITIPDVRYVIDFCLNKEMVFDSETNYSCLQLVWASKANCEQRRGRAGRCSDGKCYRLVKLHLYNSLPSYKKAALVQESLERVILQAKQLNIGEPKSILALALDPPNLNDIELTILKLKELGALTIRMGNDEIRPFDGNLTYLGKLMASLPIDIELSRLIALGHAFGLVYETVIIAGCLSTKSIFKIYYQDRLTTYKSKFKFSSGSFCDCQTLFNVYQTWRYHKLNQRFQTDDLEYQWAEENNIDIKRLKEVHLLVDELRNRLRQLNIFVPTDLDLNKINDRRNTLFQQQRLLHLKIIVAGAFYPHYYIREPIDWESVDRDLSSKDPRRTIIIRNIPANEGILYRNQIEKQFKQIVDFQSVEISFENTKGLVEFPSETLNRQDAKSSDIDLDKIVSINQSQTKIHPSIYFSIKSRMTNHKIILETFERSAALERIERLRLYLSNQQLTEIDQDRQTFEQHRNAFTHLADRQTRNKILPMIYLPDIKCQYITIHISTVVDVDHFWAQYTDKRTNIQMQTIDKILDNYEINHRLKSVEIGMVCAAPFNIKRDQSKKVLPEQNHQTNNIRYYRAKILQRVDNLTVQVLFVDWGNTEIVLTDKLRSLDRSLLQIAPLAFECQLWSIKVNSARYPSNQWPNQALNLVCSLILERQVEAEIKSVARNIVKLDICLENSSELTDVKKEHQHRDIQRTTLRQLLINREFAETSIEEHLFEHDYRIRRDAQRFVNYPTDCLTTSNNQQFSSFSEKNSIPAELCQIYDKREIGQRITLTGPYSPLESNYSSCHYGTKMRRIQIDGDSINSVSLEDDLNSNCRRLLVAFGVHLSNTRQTVSLRHTTMMPSIRGLPELISMIFAPNIELRLDPEGKMKTGVLCGLGCNNVTNTSFYPDHDIDLPFDVQITTDDLVRINEIRKQMNLALFSSDSAGNRDLIRSVRRTIHRELQKLIETKRTPIRNHYFGTFQWNQISRDDLVPNMCDDISPDHLRLFPLHDDVLIRQTRLTDEYRLKMMYHLIWLREKATITAMSCQITCELCQVDFGFTSDLFSHLSSSQHRERVKLLNLTLCV